METYKRQHLQVRMLLENNKRKTELKTRVSILPDAPIGREISSSLSAAANPVDESLGRVCLDQSVLPQPSSLIRLSKSGTVEQRRYTRPSTPNTHNSEKLHCWSHVSARSAKFATALPNTSLASPPSVAGPLRTNNLYILEKFGPSLSKSAVVV
jgi:hypothetical protein